LQKKSSHAKKVELCVKAEWDGTQWHPKWSAVVVLLLALDVRSAEANAGVCGHMMLDGCCKFV